MKTLCLIWFSLSILFCQNQTQLTFVFPSFYNKHAQFFLEIIAEFKAKHPSIPIKYESRNDYFAVFDYLKTKKSSNWIALMEQSDLLDLKQLALIRNLEEEIDPKKISEINPLFLENCRDEQNQLHAMPFNMASPMFVYNLDQLQIEKTPETWDEFYALCIAYYKRTKKAAFGFNPTWWLYENLAIQNNAIIYDKKSKTYKINSQAHQETLEFLLKLKQNSALEIVDNWNANINGFVQAEKYPIAYHTIGEINYIRQSVTFNWQVGKMLSKSSKSAITGGGNLYLARDMSDDILKQAIIFAEFLTSREIQEKTANYFNYFSIYTQKNTIQANFKDERTLNISHQISILKPKFMSKNYQSAKKIIDEMLISILIKNKDIKSSLEESQKKLNQLIN